MGSDSLSGVGDCHVYAVSTSKDTVLLIDAGSNNANRILENIGNTPLKGKKITDLILTHCHFDHIGAAHQFKELYPNMKIYAHDWDKNAIEGGKGSRALTAASWYGMELQPVNVDHVIVKDIEFIAIGNKKIRSYHTPGHTPGSISLMVEEDGKKVLFGQDVHGLFMKEFNSNIKDWAVSMKILMSRKENVKKFIQSQSRTNHQ